MRVADFPLQIRQNGRNVGGRITSKSTRIDLSNLENDNIKLQCFKGTRGGLELAKLRFLCYGLTMATCLGFKTSERRVCRGLRDQFHFPTAL